MKKDNFPVKHVLIDLDASQKAPIEYPIQRKYSKKDLYADVNNSRFSRNSKSRSYLLETFPSNASNKMLSETDLCNSYSLASPEYIGRGDAGEWNGVEVQSVSSGEEAEIECKAEQNEKELQDCLSGRGSSRLTQ